VATIFSWQKLKLATIWRVVISSLILNRKAFLSSLNATYRIRMQEGKYFAKEDAEDIFLFSNAGRRLSLELGNLSRKQELFEEIYCNE
jgi:hypothetical protein